jgi:hypothetical protein
MRLLVLAVLATTLTAEHARAGEPDARCPVRIIEATHDGVYLDPKITELKPFLEHEPYDDWKSFKLISAREFMLSLKAQDSEMLPDGSKATVTYVGHLLTPQGKHRVKLRLVIERRSMKVVDTLFALDQGGVFLQVAQKKQTKATEMLILGISCEIPH